MSQSSKVPLLVHIGYHKTATTFLQVRVFTDRRLFSQPWGAQSPEALEAFVLSHPQRFSPESVRAEFATACGAADDTVPVISHEALSGQPDGGRYYADRVVDRLHRTFPEARILIGIREQKRLLASLYYQHIRQGGTLRVEDYLIQGPTRPGFRPRVWLPHFEYDLMLELYRSRYDAENILVMPQELLQSDPDAYMRRLQDFVGLPEVDVAVEAAVNARSSNATMRMERFLNQFVTVPNPRPKRYREYPLAYRAKNRILQGMEAIGPLRRAGATKDAHIKTYIQDTVGDYFIPSNRRLAEMVGLDLQAMGYF